MKKITFIALLFLIGTVLTGCTAKRFIKRGDASMLAGQPIEAERYYRKALGHDSDLAEKPEFIEKFTRARSLAAYEKGKTLANQGMWEQAIAKFSETLEIDPESANAKQALLQARARRDETERLYSDAANLAKQRRWDDAIRQADAALRISPFHRPASDVLAVAKRSAADEHCDAGNRLLAGNNLAEAEAEFQRSLVYVPALIPAREGLARADYIRGTADQEKGQWGSALLWYTDANNHISRPEYLSKIKAARSRVFSRISFGINVNVTDANVGTVGESSALRSRVFAGISAKKPQFMRLESVNLVNPPSYSVSVRLEDLNVRDGFVRSENRTHYYTTYREIPNPELPRLRLLLQVARRDLERLIRDFNRQSLATGKPKRPTSRGKKQPTVQHSRRHGHVKTTRVTMRQIERKRAQVRHLRHRLAIAPHTITESFSARWPYVIHHYEKTGVIRASIRITNTTGVTTDVIAIRKTFRQADTTVDNPNSRIGLRGDPLILCSDAEARASLIRAAGSEIATRIVASVLKTNASESRAKAENASGSGNPIAATEAYVDLVHLVKPYDSGQAVRLLEQLRRQRR